MSTITPTTNNSQTLNCNAFKPGDSVRSLITGLAGVIIETNFNNVSSQLFVKWGDGRYSTVQVPQVRRA